MYAFLAPRETWTFSWTGAAAGAGSAAGAAGAISIFARFASFPTFLISTLRPLLRDGGGGGGDGVRSIRRRFDALSLLIPSRPLFLDGAGGGGGGGGGGGCGGGGDGGGGGAAGASIFTTPGITAACGSCLTAFEFEFEFFFFLFFLSSFFGLKATGTSFLNLFPPSFPDSSSSRGRFG